MVQKETQRRSQVSGWLVCLLIVVLLPMAGFGWLQLAGYQVHCTVVKGVVGIPALPRRKTYFVPLLRNRWLIVMVEPR